MNQINDNVTPKKIGNFNIPKTIIECKVDTLSVLELMLRKNIATWEEIDEIREAVVMHLNVLYPELQLTYSTPTPLKEEAPLPNQEQKVQKPLFYTAPPPELNTENTSTESSVQPPKVAPQSATPKITQYSAKPFVQQNQPIQPREKSSEIKEDENEEEQVTETSKQAYNSPKVMPKMMPTPPRRKI